MEPNLSNSKYKIVMHPTVRRQSHSRKNIINNFNESSL